jgi:phosphoribosylamine-glycine ligase
VLTVVGQGADLAAASEAAERAADAIHWPGMQRRRDIGWAAGAGAAGTPAGAAS